MTACGDWAGAHPGRFTYPAPPDFLGTDLPEAGCSSTFAPDQACCSRAADDAALRRGHGAALRLSRRAASGICGAAAAAFPGTARRCASLLADGEIDIAFTFNPADASSRDRAAASCPTTVRTFVPRRRHHRQRAFRRHPRQRLAKAGAMVVADFLLSPEAQARKDDQAVLGGPDRARCGEARTGRPRPFDAPRPASPRRRPGVGPPCRSRIRPGPRASRPNGHAATASRPDGAPVEVMGILLPLAPVLLAILLVVPVAAGLLGTVFPAFGILPALGLAEPTLAGLHALLATPGLAWGAWLSVFTGLGSTLLALGLAATIVGAFVDRPAFALVRRLLSPLLAVPHAAAAFGLVALIGPSGLASRLLATGVTGWTQPPDVLVVNDLCGLALLAGLALKETPFLRPDAPRRPRAGRRRPSAPGRREPLAMGGRPPSSSGRGRPSIRRSGSPSMPWSPMPRRMSTWR